MGSYSNEELKELEGIFDTFFKALNNNAEINIIEMDELQPKKQSIVDDVIKFTKVNNEKKYLIKIKNLVENSENRVSKEFSIIYFFVNKLWDLYKNNTSTSHRLGMPKITEWTNDFLLELIDNRIEGTRSERIAYDGIISQMDLISSSSYEGVSLAAKLLLISEPNIREHINLVIDFKEVIPYDEIKKIRKVMEMCSDTIFAIGDKEGIYGLGHFKDYGEAFKHNLEDKIFFIHFKGKFHYDVKEVTFIQKKTSSFTKEQETVNWSYRENLIYKIRDNRLMLREREFPKGKLIYFLNRIFPDIQESYVNELVKIIQTASSQKHGTMLVVGTKDLAEREAKRFCDFQQAIKIEKINLIGMELSKRNLIINQISRIDGAIYLDSEGNIHGIGVILDGLAHELGDSSRGARYNSAIKYKNSNQKISDNTVIIVVSEDGYIDIVVKEDEKYKYLLDSLYEKMNNKKYKQVIDEINDNKNDVSGISDFNKLKAAAHIFLREYDESVKVLKYNINLGQGDFLTYAYLGISKKFLHEYEEALDYINKSLELNKSHVGMNTRKAKLLRELGRLEEYNDFLKKLSSNLADEDFKKVIEEVEGED